MILMLSVINLMCGWQITIRDNNKTAISNKTNFCLIILLKKKRKNSISYQIIFNCFAVTVLLCLNKKRKKLTFVRIYKSRFFSSFQWSHFVWAFFPLPSFCPSFLFFFFLFIFVYNFFFFCFDFWRHLWLLIAKTEKNLFFLLCINTSSGYLQTTFQFFFSLFKLTDCCWNSDDNM